jgi:outer membrane protein assembly factor BamB
LPPDPEAGRPRGFRASVFGLLSDFGLRTSDFASPPHVGGWTAAGTRNDRLVTSWRLTVCIAAAFLLLVGAGMVAAHVRHKSSDPWRSPVLLDLKARLVAEPRNEALKDQIRQLDLSLREHYFHLLSVKADGVFLLLGGTAALLWACARVRVLTHQPPLPQPDREAEARRAREAALARQAVTVCGLLAAGGFAVLALVPARSPLADEQALAQLRPDGRSVPPPPYAITSEELRAHWPRFRGHQGGGVAGTSLALLAPPTVVWQTPVPARGFNSPLVWNNRVFLTGGDAKLREVFCLDAASGALQWRRRVAVSPPPSGEAASEIPDMTGYAASTAATDGERVYALFATGELAAFTLDGQPVWSGHVGQPENPYGHATSLVTWRDCLLVQLDQGDEESGKARIIAFDGRTGGVRWRKTRPVGASWATPIVLEAAGREQVITLGLPWVIAYQPEDGAELWRAKLLEGEITPSPVYAGDRLFLVDPGMYQLLAMRPDGRGDVTGTHVIWRVDGDMPDISSPVSNGERVFVVATGGTLTCFEAQMGKTLWKHELDVEIQASPSLVGDTLLLLSTSGEIVGLDAGPAFRELWRLKLEDQFHASPAFANASVYLRGNKTVWCLGAGPKEVAQP